MIKMNELEDDLIRDEDIKLKPYRDIVGKLTIGIGRNIDDNGISKEEALFLLRNDIANVTQQLSQLKFFDKLNPVQKDALINMCFNLGFTRFLGFKKMLAALKEGDYTTASKEMLRSKWASQVGKRAFRLAYMIKNGKRGDA
jgi:lysozyme